MKLGTSVGLYSIGFKYKKKKVSLFYQLLFTGAKILDFDSIWQLSGTASVQFMRIGGEGGDLRGKRTIHAAI